MNHRLTDSLFLYKKMVQQRFTFFDGKYLFKFFSTIVIVILCSFVFPFQNPVNRGGRRMFLTLIAGIVLGFLTACLMINSPTDNMMFRWIPGAKLSRDPHHYSDLDNEVRNELKNFKNNVHKLFSHRLARTPKSIYTKWMKNFT